MPAPTTRITIFASFSGQGGVERMLVHLIQGFCDQGYAVDLLMVRATSAALEQLPATVRRIPLRPGHTLLASFALADWLRRERPAVVLAVKDRAGRAAVMARALARTDTRLVLRLGTNLSAALSTSNPLKRWLRLLPIRRLYPAIEQIVAVSKGVAEDTAQIAQLPRGQIRVIRNPVITPRMKALAAAACPHPWLDEAESIPVIIGAGRLQRQKDFPTLVRAFSLVRCERACRLLIIGDGRGRNALEALAKTLGLRLGPDGDLELPGYQTNLYAWLARADLFVLSSAWEGSPNVLTEALALGIPAVATDCPSGPRELLLDGRYGPLVPVGDSKAMASAMLQTLDAPLPASRLQQAVTDYSQAASVSAYLDAMGLQPGHVTTG
ncbi:MAG: glycosyltransferase [Lamprobacter sp.]|uniref:glycosyltransferase n=1 Tax=Lamprobacter sp. TaxID=3100796 RepID=UPI002B259CC7|nr:glycosyltransferase [Lamprobacter sp.]MEA3640617.1 glycosyltransferase [Lamprobacter sp.]